MKQYFPSYIRDWEGLIHSKVRQDVTVGSFIPTSLKLADPVDVTCTGLKRIAGLSSGSISNDSTVGYIAPDGKFCTNVARVKIQSDDNLAAAAEKLSIGQTVHIPYRDLGQNLGDSYPTDSPHLLSVMHWMMPFLTYLQPSG